MPGYTEYIKKEFKPRLQSLADDIKSRRDKDFFWPSGTQVYCGTQGSGKTISAVKHLLDLHEDYPKAIICSNLLISGAKQLSFTSKAELNFVRQEVERYRDNGEFAYIYFQTMSELELALTMVNNDKFGVIYLVDEIHTYFNALDSKNIPMFVFTEISQQRKQRKLIIGTSQLFMRMAKPFREQCDSLIVCKTVFGFITSQVAYDGMSLEQDSSGALTGQIKKKGWFFHTRRIRSSYDTFQKVVSGAEQYESSTNVYVTTDKKTKKNLKLA